MSAAAGLPLAGRERELAAVLDAVRERAASGPRLIALVGEPGIGKSRLAAEAALAAGREGAVMLYGRADPGVDLPYEPWVDALDDLIEHLPSAVVEDLAVQHGRELIGLLPRLGQRVADAPSPRRPDGPEHRYALYAAMRAALATGASAGDGAVVVLDDLHWADAGSLLLLRRVLAGRALPVTFVAAYCESEAPDELRSLLIDAEREGRASRLVLPPLDAEAIAALLSHAGVDGADVGRVCAETGGNALFVAEIVRSLRETSQPIAALPRTVRDVVRMRVRRLGAEVEQLLIVAAVIGQEFDLAVLAHVAGRPPRQVERLLDEAVAAALLVAFERPAGRYGFAHALVARALAEHIAPAGRSAIHADAADALQRSGAPAGVVAMHRLAAGLTGDDKLVDLLVRAARDAVEQGAPVEAVAWIERALDLPAAGGRTDRRARLLVELGIAERQAGLARFRETLLEAARLAQATGDTDTLVRAATANHRGKYSSLGRPDEERIEALHAALSAAAPDQRDARARLLATLTSELTFAGEWTRRKRLADEALELARGAGEELELDILNLRFVTTWTPATLDQRLADTARGVALADRLGDPGRRFRAWQWRSMALAQSGDLRGALEAHDREAEIAAELGQPILAWTANYDAANLLALTGRLEEAEAAADAALELGRQCEQPDAAGFHANQLAVIRFDQGRLAELVPTLADIAQGGQLKTFRGLLSLALVHAGLRDEALRLVRADAAAGFGDVPFDAAWDITLVVYGQVAAELGAADVAAPLYDLLKPWAGQVCSPGVGGWGAIDRTLGLLAHTLGRGEDAIPHLERAVAWHDEMGAALWAARSRVDLARARLSGRNGADAAVTRGLLTDALRTAEACSAAGLAATARALIAAGSLAGRAARAAGARDSGPPVRIARREGEFWAVGDPGAPLRLRDSKGLRDLARLLERPGVEVPAVELAAGSATPGPLQAGTPALDEEAKAAYRRRLEDLRDAAEEAERFNDLARAAHAREEIEALGRELAGAIGLSGRDRLGGSTAERARTTVTRRLRHAIDRIAEHDPGLGRHLRSSIATGRFCVYRPADDERLEWEVVP